MYITEHTETKLILRLSENQLLYLGLQVGGAFILIGILMFSADFSANPDYDAMSAQNLNFFVKLLGGLLGIIGLVSIFTGTNNRDEAYIFDKERSVLTIEGKGLTGSFKKEYPLSNIKEVIINKTVASSPDLIPEGYSEIPTPDNFYLSLTLEAAPVSGVILQYRSPDRQLVNDLANEIRQFLDHPRIVN
ncbi:MAG: hypothetical protein VKJ46_02925 [Leptolyngbyaceae bacterium]|nr:hypothetical protein [Leptolyngbyaceae bacterium]